MTEERVSQEELEEAGTGSETLSQAEVYYRNHRSDLRALCGSAVQMMDMFLLSVALMLTDAEFFFNQPGYGLDSLFAMRISVRNLAIAGICWLAWTMSFRAMGIYSRRRLRSFAQLSTLIAIGTGLSAIVIGVCLLFRHSDASIWRPLIFYWIVSASLLFAGRIFLILYSRNIQPRLRTRRRAIVVGTGPRARKLAQDLSRNADFDYQMLGFVEGETRADAKQTEVPTIGALDDLEDILMHQPIDDVFIALPMRSHYDRIESVIAMCERVGVQSQYLTDFFKTTVTKRRMLAHDDSDRVVLQMVHEDSRLYLKRAVDIFGALFGMVFLMPLFLAISLAIKLNSKGPVIFSQVRFGLNKRQFRMYKFRSMVVDAEAQQAKLESLNEIEGPVFKIKNDPRVTKVGKFLRKTSLDELPQLANVLFGQMSLVGPRPLPMRDVNLFSESSLMRRFSVKPGMTGLWQVSGRSDTGFASWIKLDLQYIDNWSLRLDAKILLRTVSVVLRGTGAS